MNLLPLLLAKCGAATLTTKVLVAGAVSAAALGTAGATGGLPVPGLVPADDSTVTIQDDRSGANSFSDLDAELVDDDGTLDSGDDDGTPDYGDDDGTSD